MRTQLAVGIILTGGLVTGCGSSGPDFNGGIVIGAVYNDTGSVENPGISALRLAVDDMNTSGLFPDEVHLGGLLYNPYVDRVDLAVELMGDYSAVGLVTEWSSTALQVLRLTNSDYSDVVQCNGNSTSITINDPETPDGDDGLGADRNDTLYRTVSNDKAQAELLWQLVPDKTKVGIYYQDDAYGAVFNGQLNTYADEGGGFVTQSGFSEPFIPTEAQASLDAILTANQEGRLDTLILIAIAQTGGAVIKSLVEASPPFQGRILMTDGALVGNGLFQPQTGAFSAWLQTNELYATAPENFEGERSAEWLARLEAFEPKYNRSDAFTTAHGDCGYAFALAMLYGLAESGDPRANFRENMARLKADNLSSGEVVSVSPSPEGLRKAYETIKAGKKVQLEGASGTMVFDEDGDRAQQYYRVLEVKHDVSYSWAVQSVWDPSVGSCVRYCD